MTDEELLTDASRGDEAAFRELYERHRDVVFRFAYRMLGTKELAEDVAHDCFVSLIERPLGFDPKRANLRTYLFAAVRNLAMKHFRRTRRDEDIDALDNEPIKLGTDQPLSKLLDREVCMIVKQAVAQLPELQREALVLFEYEDCSLAEISRIVSADVGTVKARLYRARQALKRSLAGYFADEPETMTLEEVCK